MKTESMMVQNLCVPCGCKCRYCLLSWDGKIAGIPWEQGTDFANNFIAQAKAVRPEISYSYGFGYSMEHPKLRETISFLRKIGSPQAEFLQCDGMKLRNDEGCIELVTMLAEEGVKQLNFTFYGLQEYHNRFAGRAKDFEGMLRMIRAAVKAGLTVSSGIPITSENVEQVDALMQTLRDSGCRKISIFIPHEEGRGKSLASIRLREKDLDKLSEESLGILNRKIYRTEREWLMDGGFKEETKRHLLLSLTPDNIECYRGMKAADIIAQLEELDEAYYSAFPSLDELAKRYGDGKGDKLYRQRDLFYHYRQCYAKEHDLQVYDVTDERQSGSRRQ